MERKEEGNAISVSVLARFLFEMGEMGQTGRCLTLVVLLSLSLTAVHATDVPSQCTFLNTYGNPDTPRGVFGLQMPAATDRTRCRQTLVRHSERHSERHIQEETVRGIDSEIHRYRDAVTGTESQR